MLEKCEPEDLLKFGLIPEFVGRLPVIATLDDLDVDALVEILSEPKNALVKQYQKLFEHGGRRAHLHRRRADRDRQEGDRAQDRRARPALDRRGILLDTMFDLPSMDGVDRGRDRQGRGRRPQGTGPRRFARRARKRRLKRRRFRFLRTIHAVIGVRAGLDLHGRVADAEAVLQFVVTSCRKPSPRGRRASPGAR